VARDGENKIKVKRKYICTYIRISRRRAGFSYPRPVRSAPMTENAWRH